MERISGVLELLTNGGPLLHSSKRVAQKWRQHCVMASGLSRSIMTRGWSSAAK
jgi:hypothetical protein